MNDSLKVDKKILASIMHSERSASDISRRLKMGRTTIAYRLSRLQKMGEVCPVGKGKKNAVLWGINTESVRTNRKVLVFSGHEFHKVYDDIYYLPKQSIFYSVQGVKAMQKAFRTVPRKKILAIHKVHKKKQLIIKGITHSHFFDALNTYDNDMLASHVGRSMGIRTITSGKYFIGDGELVVTSRFMLLTNPSKRRGVVIRDKAIVQIVYEILSMLFESRDVPHDPAMIDFNEHLRSILEKRRQGVEQ